MPRSMTGFGSAEGNLRDGRVRVEIRSVNHRFFNPQLKLTPDLQGVEAELRDRLRDLMGRGHVSVSARWTGPSRTATALTVDFDRARAVVAALKQLKKRLRLKGEPDLGFVARHPDVLSAQNGDETPIVWAEVQPVVEAAARDVLAAREREGAALAQDLSARLNALEALAASVAERAPARLAAEADRLRQAVADLTAGGRLDEQRLAMEVALLADRVDLNEELVRFQAHLGACREALAGTGAVGKQLGFLAQELLREANTMGSKANDAPITHAVIAMKGELERFREQLENLE